MKLFLIAIIAAVANATDVNPLCTGKPKFGTVSVSSGALATATLSASNNTCAAETAATCFARTDGKQHFCDVTGDCASDCSACTDKTAKGNMNNDGTPADATLSASNNTCKIATAAMCFNDKLGAGKKQFCDVATKKDCFSDCSTCTDKTAKGNMNNDGTTADATLSASNNTCKIATAAMCFN